VENKINEYLKRPYSRILIPDPETGRYAAQLLEFPGCFSEGKTPQQAYKNLEQAAYNWLESAMKQSMEIPAPFSADGYSGKVALRMPKSMHRQAMAIAKREGVSLNQFLVSAVASCVGAENLYRTMADRLEAKSYTNFWYPCEAVGVVTAATSPSAGAKSGIGTYVISTKTTRKTWPGAASLLPESEVVSEAYSDRVQ